jgi:galactokinase
MTEVKAFAPGRVNLIGDHTDYTGGFVLPMAINRGTTVVGTRGGRRVTLRSESETEVVDLPLEIENPSSVSPPWGRYVAGVLKGLKPKEGFNGVVRSDLPIGAGLSSSASLEIALSLALGFDGTPTENAQLCRAAEEDASGVPCGIMDQLTSAAGQEGSALLIDCHSLDIEPVALPDGFKIVVVHSGLPRTLAGSAYADRRRECEAAEAIIGPLRLATPENLDSINNPTIKRRARHVITENERVLNFERALAARDIELAGQLMQQSHISLRDDFEVSVAEVDSLVEKLQSTDGVFGARMTGGGFGGCVVVLAENKTPIDGWVFEPSIGAAIQ